MRLRFLIIAVLGLIAGPGWSQCDASRFGRALVSDRYVDAQLSGDVLVLANGQGLVFARLSGGDVDVIGVESIPGQTNSLSLDGSTLYVTSKGTGLFTYRFDGSGGPPVREGFTEIDAISGTASIGDYLIVGGDNRLESYDTRGGLPYRLIDTVAASGPIRKVRANRSHAVVQYSDGAVQVFPFDGHFSEPRTVELNNFSAFYNFDLFGDLLILDAPNGIIWAELDESGSVIGNGLLVENRGASIVLGMTLSADLMYLRFAKEFAVYRLSARQANRISVREIDLSEIRIPKMHAFEDDFVLLNQSKSRPWSLAWYQLNGSNLNQNALVASRLDEITGVSTLGEWVFVGADRFVFYQWLAGENQLGPIDVMEVYEVGETVVDMVSGDEEIVITSAQEGNNAVTLRALGFDQQVLTERLTESYAGSLIDLRIRDGQISFVQTFRDAQEDHYLAHVVELGSFTKTVTIVRDLPIGSVNPFQFLQTYQGQLAYYDGTSLFVHQMDQIEVSRSVQIGGDVPAVLSLVFLGDVALLDFGSGIVELSLDASPRVIAEYLSWHDLTLSKSNHLFVQNSEYQIPGQHFLLERDSLNNLYAQLSILTSSAPKYMAIGGAEMLAADATSVDEYQLSCLPLDYRYVIPYRDTYELELSTAISDTAVVQLILYNTANQIIGRQLMDREIVGKLNRRKFSDWFVDVNALETPDSFVLFGSEPLTPVVSGTIGGVNGRFAYTPEPNTGTDLIFPHIANPAQGWTSELHLRNVSMDTVAEALILEPNGQSLPVVATAGGTRVLELSTNLSEETHWASIVSQQLGTVLDGFARYRRPDIDDIAVIPLIHEAFEFLVIPHVINDERYWTGLALTNPNSREVRLRVIGYDGDGQIAVDRDLAIAARAQFVVQLEQWLSEDGAAPIAWLTVVAEQPIVGIELFGSHDNHQLAGTSLSPVSGNRMVFAGVRETQRESSEVVITNRESRADSVTVEAVGASGRRLATTTLNLGVKQRLVLRLSDLFPQLTPTQLPDVQTVVVSGSLDLTGLVFRHGKQDSWFSVHAPTAVIQ